MRRAHLFPRTATLAALALLPACDGCHAKKPYTPYTLEGSSTTPLPASAPGSAAPPAADAGAPAFAVVASTAPPGDGKSWPLEGGATEAPAGHAFSQGLVFDADGDGKPDLLAWSRSPDGLRGELWFAPGKAPAEGRAIVALPADVAGPGCAPAATLSRIGAGMAVLDLDPHCSGHAREKSAHWIAVLRTVNGAAPEIGLELRLGSTADGEALAITTDGRDRDGDGRGDFSATITLTGAPKPLPGGGSAAVTLAYFDRPAGLSRDPSEPEASLKALGSAIVAEGRKKTTSPRVPGNAATLRRLHALLCEEAGKPIISTSAGPVHCSDTRLAEESAVAEIEAALNLGDALAAVGALGRLETRRKDVDTLVGKTISSIPGKLVRTTAATPSVEPSPAFGPIAFNSGGDLLVRTRDRILRVDHLSFEETPIDAAIKWPTRLTWSAGDTPSWTLTAIEERCDAPTLIAHVEAGGTTTDVPLPVPTPPRCSPQARVPASLLGASPSGDLVAVRGEIVALSREATPKATLPEGFALPVGAAVELGAGRSPDGNAIAVPTSRGVIVATLKGQGRGVTARLWTSPATDGATHCVPSNGGDRLACAVKDAVAIYDAR